MTNRLAGTRLLRDAFFPSPSHLGIASAVPGVGVGSVAALSLQLPRIIIPSKCIKKIQGLLKYFL